MVIVVDSMEDEGMDCEMIGLVEGVMDIYLLLFGLKLKSIMTPFCKDVVGIKDKFGGSKKDSMWVGFLVGGCVTAEDPA